jgi:branched-chain amino acid transport system substrate-binding protein
MTQTKHIKLLTIGVAVAVIASWAHADTVVKIGHVAPLTGEIAHLGKDQENAARLAIEAINKKGLGSPA